MLNALDNAFVYPPRMQKLRWQFLIVKRGREAEHIGIVNEPRSETGAKRVSVDSDDTG